MVFFKQKLTPPLYQHYPNPFLIKERRKSENLSLKSFFLDVGTTVRHTFPFSELQCLRRGDPRNLCEILATLSLKWTCQQRLYTNLVTLPFPTVFCAFLMWGSAEKAAAINYHENCGTDINNPTRDACKCLMEIQRKSESVFLGI